MENKYRCDICKDSGAVKTGEFEYSDCPCLSDDRRFEIEQVSKLTLMHKINYLIELYEKERLELMEKIKPLVKKQEYFQAKPYQDRKNHITEFIAQLKLMK